MMKTELQRQFDWLTNEQAKALGQMFRPYRDRHRMPEARYSDELRFAAAHDWETRLSELLAASRLVAEQLHADACTTRRSAQGVRP